MTQVDVETPPFILTKPSLKINDEELRCSVNQISHGIDQDTNDYDTFCGTYRVYGVARHSLTVTVYQNFDPTGPWAVLSALANQVVPFELLPDDTIPQGPTNPLMFGDVRVPAMPFLDAAVNEASSIDVELSIQGVPHYAPPETAPVAAAASTSSGSSGSTSSSTTP